MIPQINLTELSEREDYKYLQIILTLIYDLSDTVFFSSLNMAQYNNLVKFVKQIDENQLKNFSGKFI